MKRSFIAIVLSLSIAPAAFGQVIAFEDFDSDSNLISYSNNIPGGVFGSAGDGFGEFTRLVSGSIPFNISDDSVTGGAAGSGNFAADNAGFLGDENNNNTVFAVTDTWNPDTNNAETTGTWSFDISSASNPLVVQADMAAFHDWSGSTLTSNIDFFYQIDGGGFFSLFTSSVDIGGSRTYTMDDGDTFTYDDPLNMTANGVVFELNENFQTLTGNVNGLGSQLDIQVRANLDGTESFGLDNLRIVAVPEPAAASILGLIAFAGFCRRRR